MSTFNRRDFVRGSLAASALAVLPSGNRKADAAPAPVEPLRMSILSYSFRGLLAQGKMDVFGYLESCKYRYGLHMADIWNGFLPSYEEEFINKVKEALIEREMVLADLCVDQAHVWEDEPEARETNYRNALAALNAGRIMGARFVRIDAGSRRATWSDEEFDHIVSRYKEYAQYAHDHGFKMGAENHWGPEGVWSNMKRLYEAVDHPAFGISCHLGGWTGDEAEKARADREAAPWVCHTHIAWNICTDPALLQEKLGNLWKVGYEGSYSVEHHTGEDEYREIAIQLALARDTLEHFREDGVPD